MISLSDILQKWITRRGSTKTIAVKKQKVRTLELEVDVLDFKMVIAKQRQDDETWAYMKLQYKPYFKSLMSIKNKVKLLQRLLI